jgi:3-oxoadipate enol-lactonase
MIQTQHVMIGGRRMRYLENGAGWPVVLIHGWPLSADMWRPQLEDVPDGWRFIAPDLRGFGGSVASALQPTMDDYAADVAGLLDTLEIDRAAIGGLSMGGYVTFALFRLAPERFTRILLADTRPQADTPEGRQKRRAMSETVRTKGASAVADQMIPKLLGETSRRQRPAVARLVRRLIEANDPVGIDGAVDAMRTRPDSTPDLERISCPALVIVGEEDEVTPVAESESLHNALRRSHLVVVPGAGHLSNLEEPEGFSRALTDFLRSNI